MLNTDTVDFVMDKYSGLTRLEKWHLMGRLSRCPYDKLTDYLPEKGNILDVGCGHGHFGWYLKKINNSLKYFGTDLDSEKIRIANESALAYTGSHKPEFYEGEPGLIKSMPAKFESIFLLDVVYLIPWNVQLKLLQSLLKKLSENGCMIIKTHFNDEGKTHLYWQMKEWLMINILKKTKGSGTIYGGQPITRYRTLGEEHGCSLEVISMGEMRRILVFRPERS